MSADRRAGGSGNPATRREPVSELAKRHGIEPFALFCAYYLGITADDRYEFQNVHHVAKRFGVGAGVIKQVLQDCGMDTDSIVNSTFDMSAAQIDVMKVPEGISRIEVAREHWQRFLDAPRARRDWAREIECDRIENEKVFGAGNPRRNDRRHS